MGLCNLPQFWPAGILGGYKITAGSSLAVSHSVKIATSAAENSKLFVSGDMGGWERGLREALLRVQPLVRPLVGQPLVRPQIDLLQPQVRVFQAVDH